MSTKTIMKFAAPFFVATLVPMGALAQDQELTAAQEECVENCLKADGSTAAVSPTDTSAMDTAAPAPKANGKNGKKSKTTASAETPAPGSSSSATVVVPPSPMAPDQATIDSIRAEERARAAEEFGAGHQQAMQQNEQALEQAKAEERARVESEAQEKLANERMRYEQALAAERMKGGEKIQDALITPAGVYGFVGGGVNSFTESGADDLTDVGGAWEARVGIGSRSIIGAEVAYVGTARDIVALGLDSDAFLVSNGLEGVARLNVPITPDDTTVLIEPYTFAGLGWNRFNISSDEPNTSSLDDVDNVLSVPLGIGIAVGFSGVTLDARATYRQAVGSDLIEEGDSSFDDTSLNSWGLGAALGFEF